MGKEEDIIRHFDLCASLMSDPVILTKYPEIVVSQFYAAKASVETLGVFLTARGVDPCGCHVRGWMDLSIISRGIGELVAKTLDTHMGVVRMVEFPEIFKRDFNVVMEGRSDNYTIREIKESNCMGSIVLLYYYLYWYLCLILLNKRLDPMYCTKDQLDIEILMKKLPNSRSFFEFRALGRSFGEKVFSSGNKEANERFLSQEMARNNFMFSEIVIPIENLTKAKRSTLLIPAYRRALWTNLGAEDPEDLFSGFPAEFKDKQANFVFNSITVSTVLFGMTAMGGMGNVIETQRSTDKWADMYKDISVAGWDEAQQARYKTKLRKAVSSPAYISNEQVWLSTARTACIYDYCSASLMMDICRSFQQLTVLVQQLMRNTEDSIVLKLLFRVMMNLSGYTSDKKAIDRILKECAIPEMKDFSAESLTFISKTDSDVNFTDKTYAFRSKKKIRYWVDAFKALYPTGNLANSANRQFFLCCDDDEPEQGFEERLSIIFNTLRGLQERNSTKKNLFGPISFPLGAVDTHSVFCPYLRNSWMLIHGSTTNLALWDSITKAPYFKEISLDMAEDVFSGIGVGFTEDNGRIGDVISYLTAHKTSAVFYDFIKDLPEGLDEDRYNATMKNKVTGLYKGKYGAVFSFTDIARLTKSNIKYLENLMQASRKFKRYPALAWPVYYYDSGEDATKRNISAFKKIGDIQRKTGTPYVDARTAEVLASSADASRRLTEKMILRLEGLPVSSYSPGPAPSAADGGAGGS